MSAPPDDDAALELDVEPLLAHLRTTRGLDLTGYKRPTVRRRVHRRMQEVGAADLDTYLDVLEVRPEEFRLLFDALLINVTAFFRDPAAWEALRTSAVAPLLERAGTERPIRVWCAGCSTGQEAYTLAIVLAEAVGVEAFTGRVKIYATDIDEAALDAARAGVYDAGQLGSLSDEQRSTFFEPQGDRFAFRRDLRRSLIFGRHDLIQDAPIGRLDLLSCRNTLMYFTGETQSRVLQRYHFALERGAYLFLGKAETLLSQSRSFKVVDLKQRIFQADGERRHPLLRTGADDAAPVASAAEAALEVIGTAAVVVDGGGVLVHANQQARASFGFSMRDIGRRIQDLELSYRPTALVGLIEEAHRRQTTLVAAEQPYVGRSSEQCHFDVEVTPLADSAGGGTLVAFRDVTALCRLRVDLEHSQRELETAYEELQSTNEELETMNEELQSTNEELTTINDELRERTDDVTRANASLRAILVSLRAGVIVVDEELRVLVWSDGVEELFGLRHERAVGRHLVNLDVGMDLGGLVEPVRAVLEGGEPVALDLVGKDRRGRDVTCRTTVTGAVDEALGEAVAGAVLVLETDLPPAGV